MKIITNSKENINVNFNGKSKAVDFIDVDDTIYLPIDKLCELFDYNAKYNSLSSSIDITTNVIEEGNITTATEPETKPIVVENAESTNTVKEETKADTVVQPDPIAATKYSIIGITHVIEIDPRNIFSVETQKPTNKTPYKNFVNSLFFMPQANGIMFPQGIAVNAGEVQSNYATHGKPVATLVCYGWNDVQLKYISDITTEKNVWFAVSGYGVYPKITASEEGFTGKFSDVTRSTNRVLIGYRKSDNKIVIAVRANSDANRASETAKNLELDFAICLDSGGSTTLKVNDDYKFKGDGRTLWGGIIWR